MANKVRYICAFCEGEFFDWPSNHRTVCSLDCRNKKRKRDAEVAVKCFVCGKLVFVCLSEAKTRKVCGLSCRGKLNAPSREKMLGNKFAFLGDSATDSAHRWRARQFGILIGQCNVCGEQGQLLHHIDGDVKNNCLSNLELLCRKCHINHHRSALMAGRLAVKKIWEDKHNARS